MDDPTEPLRRYIDSGGTFLGAERLTGISDATLAYWYRNGMPRWFPAYVRLLAFGPALDDLAGELKRRT